MAEFGAPFKRIEKFIEAHKDLRKKPITAQLLAHIWWQDKLIAGFVREMSAKFPHSVFVITGDHYDREYPFTPSLRISQSVPFIVYAPSLALEVRANVGAHIDITPTIVEIVAPKGFGYHSFGKPLVGRSNSVLGMQFCTKNAESSKNNSSLRDSAKQNRGNPPCKNITESQNGLPRRFCESAHNDDSFLDSAFGFGAIATNNFIFDGFNIESFNKKKGDKALASEYFKHLQRVRALSWWILQKGWVIE